MAPPRKPDPNGEIFVARESFATELDGVPISVFGGVTRVRAGHPLLKGREQMFEPITVHYDVDDQPSPARGETRG